MNHFELNDDGSGKRLDEAQAKALGWMLDKVQKASSGTAMDVLKASTPPSESEVLERMFMARNKEACIMEQAIVEALTWLDSGASGKAYGTLSQVMEKLSAMRVKEGQ